MEQDLVRSAERLFNLLSAGGLTLSVAESCTGGLVCHAITSIAGSSKVFHSGLVAYSNDAKVNILGVDEGLISSVGAVSREAAEAMADAVRLKTGTDVSLAVTGNLGPEVLEGKELGLVYLAVSFGSETLVKEKVFHGDRRHNKYEAAREGIEFLLGMLSEAA